MKRLKAWARLSPRDRRGFLCAWILLLVAEMGLHTSTLERCRRWLRRLTARPRKTPGIDVSTVVWWVGAAARHHLVAMTCLRRSLVLEALLARHGFEPVLRLGVRREGETLEAHAWVELDGAAVGEAAGQETTYAVLRPSTTTA